MLKSFSLFSRARLLVLALLLFAVAPLSGCATIEGWFSNPSSTAAVQTATTLAVGEAILSAKDAASQKQLAVDIIAGANAVNGALTGNATVATLSALIQTQIAKANLNPQQLLAVNTLLTFAQAELSAKLSTGVLKPQDQVIVSQFVGWVVAAATPFSQ